MAEGESITIDLKEIGKNIYLKIKTAVSGETAVLFFGLAGP